MVVAVNDSIKYPAEVTVVDEGVHEGLTATELLVKKIGIKSEARNVNMRPLLFIRNRL